MSVSLNLEYQYHRRPSADFRGGIAPMKTALYILAGILVLALVLVQLGVLGGSRSADLGVSMGRL